MEQQKAFDMIAQRVGNALADQNFVGAEKETHDDHSEEMLFATEDFAYSLSYSPKKQRFALRAGDKKDGSVEDWKTISVWLFDQERDSLAEAESIANEFVDILSAPKRTELMQQRKKRKKDEEDSSTDPIFFFNRLVGVFPELKDEMARERVQYGQIRPFAFAKEHIAPKAESLARRYKDSDPCQRMCKLFSDLYDSGDMDVRSLITIVLLNGMPDATFEGITALLSDDLKVAGRQARKFIGKKIKPEKKKKAPKYTAETLADMRKRM